MLGVNRLGAFDSINLQKLYSVGSRGIKLFTSYFSERKELVEIGGKRGSGLSPLFFLLYFIRGVWESRTCLDCREENNLSMDERKGGYPKCGAAVCFANDLTATNICKGFDSSKIVEKISKQDLIISHMICRLQLAVNKGKSWFITSN